MLLLLVLLIIAILAVMYNTCNSKFGGYTDDKSLNCNKFSGNLPALNDLTQEEQDKLLNKYITEQNKPS